MPESWEESIECQNVFSILLLPQPFTHTHTHTSSAFFSAIHHFPSITKNITSTGTLQRWVVIMQTTKLQYSQLLFRKKRKKLTSHLHFRVFLNKAFLLKLQILKKGLHDSHLNGALQITQQSPDSYIAQRSTQYHTILSLVHIVKCCFVGRKLFWKSKCQCRHVLLNCISDRWKKSFASDSQLLFNKLEQAPYSTAMKTLTSRHSTPKAIPILK